uniref:Uncharacterized protein n=1 Tax=Physcomitrium patens TaxID=3218 RepID=A0A2K1J1D7_PHYPA|nr:hypothetical protein PHYPA_023243 [Physcomitrium patens]
MIALGVRGWQWCRRPSVCCGVWCLACCCGSVASDCLVQWIDREPFRLLGLVLVFNPLVLFCFRFHKLLALRIDPILLLSEVLRCNRGCGGEAWRLYGLDCSGAAVFCCFSCFHFRFKAWKF